MTDPNLLIATARMYAEREMQRQQVTANQGDQQVRQQVRQRAAAPTARRAPSVNSANPMHSEQRGTSLSETMLQAFESAGIEEVA